jgi:hypothetical protein
MKTILLSLLLLLMSCSKKTTPLEKYPLPELYNGPTINGYKIPDSTYNQISIKTYNHQ